jgi:hypothetical protein
MNMIVTIRRVPREVTDEQLEAVEQKAAKAAAFFAREDLILLAENAAYEAACLELEDLGFSSRDMVVEVFIPQGFQEKSGHL